MKNRRKKPWSPIREKPRTLARETIYDPFTSGFSEKVCFLCGVRLNSVNRTVEHVFPQWLIRHFQLNTRGVSIKGEKFDRNEPPDESLYSSKTIPCCRKCNSEILAPLEARIHKNIIIKDDNEFDLTDAELFWWTAKIYYGVYLCEHFRGEINLLGALDHGPSYASFRTVFLFLQTRRIPTSVKGNFFFEQIGPYLKGFPVSAFTFNVKLPRKLSRRFDFADDWIHECVYLRCGTKAVLIAFDSGFLAYHGGHEFELYQKHLLHPIQMGEIATKFFHMAELRTDYFRFFKSYDSDQIIINYDYEKPKNSNEIVLIPLNYGPLFTKRPFGDGQVIDRYNELLVQFTKVRRQDLPPDQTCTWLRGPGSTDFLNIDIDENLDA